MSDTEHALQDLPVGIEATGERTEFDSMGRMAVPADRYWGAQTQRSLHHFSIGSDKMPLEVYRAYGVVKKACALVNRELGGLPGWKAEAIVRAADEAIGGDQPDPNLRSVADIEGYHVAATDGDIGHVQLPDAGDTVCQCGNTGCIEAVASGTAMARQLTALGFPARNSADVVALVQSGNRLANQVLRKASARIGSLVATLVNCFNPATIVVGGPLAPLRDDLLAGIRAVVYQRATPLATRSLTIEGSQLGERAGVIGAIALMRGHLFSPGGLAGLSTAAHPDGARIPAG